MNQPEKLTPMPLTPSHIKFIQAEFKRMGHDPGPVVGLAGNATKAALDKVTDLPKTWPLEKKHMSL